jgi:CheY-like chemotaxis protein
MSSRQLYRQPRTREQTVEELREWRGKQWDPAIVDLVLGLIESGELQLSSDGLHLLEHAPARLTVPGLSVLLVEDDDDHALLVTEMLERALEGAVVSRAGSVAGAAELSNGSTWSLAVVDHNLPDGLGMQVLDALRADDPTMPIVMLTGQGSEEMAIEAFRHGASDYVVKGSGYLEALASRVRGLVTVA